MKSLIKLAIGAVAGYSVSRALEARASGVPLSAAFNLENGIKGFLTPVASLQTGPRMIVVGDTRPVVDVTGQ